MANSETPTLIVCGLEGVLAPAMGSASQACDLAAAQLYCAVGGHLTVFTHRGPAAIRAALGRTAVDLPVAACGGAMLYSLKRDCLVQARTLTAQTARELLQYVQEQLKNPGIIGVDERGRTYLLCASREAQLLLNREGGTYEMIPPESAGDRWCKLVICAAGREIQQLKEHLEQNPELPVTIMRQDAYTLELVASQVQAGEALEHLCTLAGCEMQQAEAVIAQPYDAAWAEGFGKITVLGDAGDDVKQTAQQVLGSYRMGGMGEYLYGRAAAMQEL